MKKLLIILMLTPLFSIGQQVPLTMDQSDTENWVLLKDSNNIKQYRDPDLDCKVNVYYESIVQDNIAIMEFLFNKSDHSMMNFINSFDEDFDRVHNPSNRIWVMNSRDNYYKLQIIERGDYNQYFSVLIQKHSY